MRSFLAEEISMSKFARLVAFIGGAAIVLATGVPLHAAPVIINGGFESGFASWTRADQVGGDGTFMIQSGTSSPVNGDPVPAPPAGLNAAMTDGIGPGSHVLFQDFLASLGNATLRFDLFLGNRADRYATPASLDFALTNINGDLTLNQQARVDILRAGANPFSVAAADILLTVYRTQVGDALVSGYSAVAADIGALLAAHSGELLRLRFAETDNLAPLQMGIDNVRIDAIPEPSTMLLFGVAMTALVVARSGRRRA
jgi:hypothetical protein